LSRELSQRVGARMCQNLYRSYGSAETATVAFGPASLLENEVGAVGYVQTDAVVEAVDGSGQVLPALRDGALRIRTAYMAEGYVGDSETSEPLFRGGDFFSSGVGHPTPPGLFVITDH